MILVDQPIWPAHGTVWAHLISDTSLEELREFARATGLPPRGFDLDHYDVPASRIPDLVAAGAVQVSPRELLARLVASGLRVRGTERELEAARRRDLELRRRWLALARITSVVPGDVRTQEAWSRVGADLLQRWSQPHRHYHDVSHLHDVLLNLDTLEHCGESLETPVLLAAWFHDAVYEGQPGEDEEASARLAETMLGQVGVGGEFVAETARLVRVTVDHRVAPADTAAAVLVDADLAILGAPAKRYAAYAAAVRREFAHVPDEAYRAGRSDVLVRLLDRDRLFLTRGGRRRWEDTARANVAAELARLRA